MNTTTVVETPILISFPCLAWQEKSCSVIQSLQAQIPPCTPGVNACMSEFQARPCDECLPKSVGPDSTTPHKGVLPPFAAGTPTTCEAPTSMAINNCAQTYLRTHSAVAGVVAPSEIVTLQASHKWAKT
eukprot:6101773-Amphidinium_carterae.1